MAKKASSNTQFDWFEVFKAGTQTDSKGKTQTFSNADLNSVVANFTPKTAPLVIGHPKMDSPAWGWASELKAEDGVLYAKADEVSSEFAQAVEDKRYPNRSVRLEKVENGYKLAHIGYLGGKPPAVEGLAWQFNQDENVDTLTFEFSAGDMDSISLRTSNTLTRLMGNLRNFITDRFGSEAADKVVPEYESEWLKEETIIAEHERSKSNAEFSKGGAIDTEINSDATPPTHEDNAMDEEEKKALQDQLDAANAKNQQLEYNQRVTAAKTFINDEVNSGNAPRLTNTEGVAEFMASLDDGDTTFEFAAADGENQALKPADWFKGFLKGLPEQTGLTSEFNKDDTDGEDSNDTAETLAAKALEYQQSQSDKGVTISISSALDHIKKA
ncbi:hypothetical protein D0907_08300 [Pseudoalteromonas lipolytica]|uniref:Peptidase n=1 Tax=Pseudoalteromonas lipolytica TaxID=570156 RepID=A0AAD0RZA1_9GAMM|nr:hypothetical protein [Pseudoalteromonas donghaensis]AXV65269.1 hypothetical protein D0907_08300 [Pseudoalteromonas donghaensis]